MLNSLDLDGCDCGSEAGRGTICPRCAHELATRLLIDVCPSCGDPFIGSLAQRLCEACRETGELPAMARAALGLAA